MLVLTKELLKVEPMESSTAGRWESLMVGQLVVYLVVLMAAY